MPMPRGIRIVFWWTQSMHVQSSSGNSFWGSEVLLQLGIIKQAELI